MHKNFLTVVGITILFLGLAIQPSIATVQPKQIEVEPDVEDVEGLVAQLRIVINEILQEYGHIPIIKTLCNKIVGILDSIGLILFCIFLYFLSIFLFILLVVITILGVFFKRIFTVSLIENLFAIWFLTAIEVDRICGYAFPEGSNSPLKSLSNINRIVASDSPTLTGLDECPCMQE